MKSDDVLLKQMRMKQEQSLQTFMNEQYGYLSSIVRRIIGKCMTEEDVEEVVQDSFVKLWNHADEIDLQKASVRTYLTAITRNTAKNKLRQLRPNEKPLTEILEDTLSIETEEADQEMTRNRQRQVLNRAMEAMDAKSRAIFIRHYYLYEGVEEIAEKMGMPSATVKTRLRRGREQLKQILSQQGYRTLEDI